MCMQTPNANVLKCACHAIFPVVDNNNNRGIMLETVIGRGIIDISVNGIKTHIEMKKAEIIVPKSKLTKLLVFNEELHGSLFRI